jgi:hypothetical protein
MKISRRLFIRDGVATVTIGLAAPAFLADIAQAQGIPGRRLVVVYWAAATTLSTLVRIRTVVLAAAAHDRDPAGQVLQVGTDAAGRALGLHRVSPRWSIFNEGRLALVQRRLRRTPAVRTSRRGTSGGRRTRRIPPGPGGWDATSIRCRGR